MIERGYQRQRKQQKWSDQAQSKTLTLESLRILKVTRSMRPFFVRGLFRMLIKQKQMSSQRAAQLFSFRHVSVKNTTSS